jgi:hypothetical protein
MVSDNNEAFLEFRGHKNNPRKTRAQAFDDTQ